MAGGDVPVTVCQWGEAAAKDLEGYRHLGVERVLLELRPSLATRRFDIWTSFRPS